MAFKIRTRRNGLIDIKGIHPDQLAAYFYGFTQEYVPASLSLDAAAFDAAVMELLDRLNYNPPADAEIPAEDPFAEYFPNPNPLVGPVPEGW